jgi:ethanolamine utilization protein EutA
MCLAEPGIRALKHCGLSLGEGDRVGLDQLRIVARAMAGCIKHALTRLDLPPMTRDLLTVKPLALGYDIGAIMFSGGVADYVYRDYPIRSVSDVSIYGDMGPLLGQAIREVIGQGPFTLVAPAETIRATVIGAGAQSISLSGSTIMVDDRVLPMRNVPVLRLFGDGVPTTTERIAREVSVAIDRGQDYSGRRTVALAFPGPVSLSYPDICSLADGLLLGLKESVAEGIPVVTVTQSDCAKVLGQSLAVRLAGRAAVVSLDQISVDEGDFIDIGKPLAGGRVVPVIVKTLVFENKAGMEG